MSLTGFTRPSYSAIEERVRGDVNAGFPGADSRLRRSVLGVLTKVLAGSTHGLYGYLDWIARQAMPLYAEAGNLDAWGAVWGVCRKPAAKAGGAVRFTGMDGAAIRAGAELRDGNGVAYVVTTDGAISDGTALVTVAAAEAGAGGNQIAGVALTLSTPIAGVTSAGAVGRPRPAMNPVMMVKILERFSRSSTRGKALSHCVPMLISCPAVCVSTETALIWLQGRTAPA